MPENGNKNRPVRTLIVKNFSVIKEAKLEFGKITVLIGPQASGKSLLCRLAFFLSREALEIATKSIMEGLSYHGFLDAFRTQFVQRFAAHSRLGGNAEIEFSSGAYSVRSTWLDDSASEAIPIQFSPQFSSIYAQLARLRSSRALNDLSSSKDFQEDIWTHLYRSFFDDALFRTIYVPAGRSFMTATGGGLSVFQGMSIDPLIVRFVTEISWNEKSWRVGSVTAGDGAWEKLHRTIARLVLGTVTLQSGVPMFKDRYGRTLPLSLLSSGTQEMLPLLNVLERVAAQQEHQNVGYRSLPGNASAGLFQELVYVEEPEADVFPSTQNELIRLFAWLSNREYWAFNWVITTHSPYILSAFNNLIEASQVVTAKPELKDEVAKLIPEQYWINSSDFRAYSIHDGNLEPIMDKETGLINGAYLDAISNKIGADFDELLRMAYVKS